MFLNCQVLHQFKILIQKANSWAAPKCASWGRHTGGVRASYGRPFGGNLVQDKRLRHTLSAGHPLVISTHRAPLVPCSRAVPSCSLVASGLLQANSTIPLDWSSQSSLALGACYLTQAPHSRTGHGSLFPVTWNHVWCLSPISIILDPLMAFWAPPTRPLPTPNRARFPVAFLPGQAQQPHDLSHFRKPGVPGRVGPAPLLTHSRFRSLRASSSLPGKGRPKFTGSLGIHCL